jgi:hypothetical protein
MTLINKDRTWKTIICLNPTHSTVQFETNEIGGIKCPICEALMITIVKSVVIIENIVKSES